MEPRIRERLARAFETAIRAESDGHHFYRMAAQSSADPKGREVLSRLADEELDHQRYLQHQRKALLESGALDPGVALGPRLELTGPSPIFSTEIQDRLSGAHFEMTALSVGIQLELNAERFYAGQARAAEEPVVRELFERLAAWESGHYSALLRQHETLKQSYWDQAGFAPF